MTVAAAVAGAVVAALLPLPLAWKWQLGMRRTILGLSVILILAAAVAVAVGAGVGLSAAARALLAAALTLLAAFAVLAYRFYRDPERTPPGGDDVVVSPADGVIVYVKSSQDGHLPLACKRGHQVPLEELTRTPVHDGEAVVVGIGMSFLDVHVNRAPIAGRVRLQRRFPGSFGSLGRPEMVFRNERATTLIAGRKLEVAVVQIASRLVRQIASYVGEGEEVKLGQRIGIIRFGSQVDVVLPSRQDLSVHVREGDRVTAGTSIIASVRVDAVP